MRSLEERSGNPGSLKRIHVHRESKNMVAVLRGKHFVELRVLLMATHNTLTLGYR